MFRIKGSILGINTLLKDMEKGQTKPVKTDNTASITYTNNMGGTVFLKCNVLSQGILEYFIGRQAWISAEQIPRSENSIAYFISRALNENTE